VNEKLRPKLWRELKPGPRKLFLWIIPE